MIILYSFNFLHASLEKNNNQKLKVSQQNKAYDYTDSGQKSPLSPAVKGNLIKISDNQ